MVVTVFLLILGCTESQVDHDDLNSPTATIAHTKTPQIPATTAPVVPAEPITSPKPDTSINTPTPEPTATLRTALPAVTSPPPATPVPEGTPPPYHFLTVEEVEAALSEVGCSGWRQVQIGGITYNRVCANDDNYAANVMGAPTTAPDVNERESCQSATDTSVRFTAVPTDLSLVRSIVPPGSPSGGTIAGHSYIHGKNAVPGESMRVPVYAVADSTLTNMAYYISNDSRFNFYFLSFGVSCEISYMYDHIVEVVPKIAAVAPTTASVSSATDGVRSTVTFKAGELIGYVGEGTWDFGASDTTHINQFANQQRYVELSNGQALYQICPYDYFSDPLKSQMYALFGDPGGELYTVTNCSPAKDVLGSAAGQWFDIPDIESGQPMLGIAMLPGNMVEISSESSVQRVFPDNPTWQDPELLTSTHCYASDGQWTYIEIHDEGKQMSLAAGSGDCPISLPSNARVYYR